MRVRKYKGFTPRVPNASSLYSLGWVRLERYVQIKKLLFIRSILAMGDDEIVKIVFIEKARRYFLEGPAEVIGGEWSIVRDLLNITSLFNLEDEVRNMIERDHMYEKNTWKKLVWDRAWSLEDTFWRIEVNLKKELKILSNVNPSPRYSTWWALSDNDHSCIYFCETMVRLNCHASLLKDDDIRLKGQARVAKLCSHCDLGSKENAKHLVLQCPRLQGERTEMFASIELVVEHFNNVVNRENEDIFNILLGRSLTTIPDESMKNVWKISGYFIHKMYKLIVQRNEGIG